MTLQVVVLYVMDGPYTACLFRTVPNALTWAAHLLADGISSCCYTVNVKNHPSSATSREEGMAWYSCRPMPSLCLIHLQTKERFYPERKGGNHHGLLAGRGGRASDSHVSRVFLFHREDRRQ